MIISYVIVIYFREKVSWMSHSCLSKTVSSIGFLVIDTKKLLPDHEGLTEIRTAKQI